MFKYGDGMSCVRKVVGMDALVNGCSVRKNTRAAR